MFSSVEILSAAMCFQNSMPPHKIKLNGNAKRTAYRFGDVCVDCSFCRWCSTSKYLNHICISHLPCNYFRCNVSHLSFITVICDLFVIHMTNQPPLEVIYYCKYMPVTRKHIEGTFLLMVYLWMPFGMVGTIYNLFCLPCGIRGLLKGTRLIISLHPIRSIVSYFYEVQRCAGGYNRHRRW